MNAVPEQIRMRLLDAGRAMGFSGLDLAKGARAGSLRVLSKTQRRRRENRHACFLGLAKNRDRVFQRAGDRFVDEHHLARLQDRTKLSEMRSAIVGLQQYRVDFFEQVVDRIHDLHAQLLNVLGVFGHTADAALNVRAAFRISGDDATIGELGSRIRIV